MRTTLGTLLYDGECAFCRATARMMKRLFKRFDFRPLQSQWAQERLQFQQLPDEMKLLLVDGRVFGGADALLQMAATIWWLMPVAKLGAFAPVHTLLVRAYQAVAKRRRCLGHCCRKSRQV